MGNPFKGGGDGGGRDGGDRTGDGGGFFKSAWEAVSQDIWGEPPQRKQESSTTPKNPIKKAFDAISHLSLEAIPALSDKFIDKLQPADKQLKETDEKPQEESKKHIYESVEIEAQAKNGDLFARDTMKMLGKAGDNKDWRTIIKEAYTNVVTQFKNFFSGGDNQLQEAPQAATGSLDAVNLTRFQAKIQEDLNQSNASAEPLTKHNIAFDSQDRESARDDWPVINPEKEADLTKDPEHQLEGHIMKVSHVDDKPIGWLEAAQKMAQLPFDKQLQVIGVGLSSGINEYNHQQRERSIGALIGTVQGVGTIATNLAKVTDFTAALIKGDKEAANQGAAEFGEALGSTIVGGVKLFEGAHRYLNDVGKAGYEGDYTKVFRDIDNLGKHLNKAWSELPPREQARIISKLGTELAADGLIGLGTAKAAGKLPSQFTKILDTISNDAQRVHKAGKNITDKSVRAIEEAVDDLLQPEFVTPDGQKIKLGRLDRPRADKPDTGMLMSKADDLDGLEPKQPEKGMKGDHVPEKYTPRRQFLAELRGVIDRLSPGEKALIDKHGIKIKPIRQITDKFPKKADLAACYDASENTIYVPEQVLKFGKPVPNYDLEFAFRHEFGHVYNIKVHPFGEPVCDLPGFIRTFRKDFEKLTLKQLDELRLSDKYKTLTEARDEVFADMYAHATGLQSNNPYSQKVKRWFPNCLKHAEEMPKL